MSQRGGSVSSDVRFGDEVLSPMVPPGEADFLVLLDAGQLDPNRHVLRPGGVLIEPGMIDSAALSSKRSLNVALMGALSAWLGIPEEDWLAAVRASLREGLHAANLAAFQTGRAQPEHTRTERKNGRNPQCCRDAFSSSQRAGLHPRATPEGLAIEAPAGGGRPRLR